MPPRPRSELLATAARVLGRVGELPPLMVTCTPDGTVLPPLALTPASLSMDARTRGRVVHAVAAAMGWPAQPLREDQGWTATGKVEGIQVQALTARLPGSSHGPLARAHDVTTAEHARLLRDLIDWASGLPAGVEALEVVEDLRHPRARFRARLVLPEAIQPSRVVGLVLPVPDDGWNGYSSDGLLPTGHALTISTGT